MQALKHFDYIKEHENLMNHNSRLRNNYLLTLFSNQQTTRGQITVSVHLHLLVAYQPTVRGIIPNLR